MINLQTALEHACYIKPVMISGQKFYSIFSANGEQLTTIDSKDVAFQLVKNHDMIPMSVH